MNKNIKKNKKSRRMTMLHKETKVETTLNKKAAMMRMRTIRVRNRSQVIQGLKKSRKVLNQQTAT